MMKLIEFVSASVIVCHCSLTVLIEGSETDLPNNDGLWDKWEPDVSTFACNVTTVLKQWVLWVIIASPLYVLQNHGDREAPEKEPVLGQEGPNPPGNECEWDWVFSEDPENVIVHNAPGEQSTESAVEERLPVYFALSLSWVEDFVAVAELDVHCANHEAAWDSNDVQVSPEHK